MFVAPVNHFRAVGIAQPAPARKMPELDIAHGDFGENAAMGPI